MKPFATMLLFTDRMITPYGHRIERRLSDLRGMYQDIAEAEAILERSDPLIYEVYTVDVPDERGQLPHCLMGHYDSEERRMNLSPKV